MTRLTKRQARALGIEVKSKYHSRKETVDGITFDSRKEANRYRELCILKRAGEVVGIELQPEFVLQEGFRHNGKWHRPITYRADFRVTYADGRVEVEDVKGMRTDTYKLKKKLLLAKYEGLIFKEV